LAAARRRRHGETTTTGGGRRRRQVCPRSLQTSSSSRTRNNHNQHHNTNTNTNNTTAINNNTKNKQTNKQWYRHLPEPLIFFRVLQAALPLVLWSCAFSTFVGLYAEFLEPKGAPNVVQNRDYAPVLQVASTALALLLVFRTNSSYSRWQEGRQLFGLFLNYPRNLARIAAACVGPSHPTPAPVRDALIRLSASLPPAAAAFFRRDPALLRRLCGSEAGGVLRDEELALVERAAAEQGVPQPIVLAQLISQLFARAAGLDTVDRQAAEAQLSAMDIALGGCQRLESNPIPMAYTRHTSRFLVAYLMLLPVTLFPSLGWLTIPIVAILAFFLGGVENVGVQIENPLRILPLEAMARRYRDAALAMGRAQGPVSEMADAIAGGGDFAVAPRIGVGGKGGERRNGASAAGR
jgi:ion channel-forming bestrophin family protein